MSYDTLFRNAHIVTEFGRFDGGIAVKRGQIAALFHGHDEKVTAETTIDLKGNTVFPGVVDGHVHFSQGRGYEDYEAGSKASAAGGVTTAVDMPLDDLPPITSRERLEAKRHAVHSSSVVDYAHWGGLVPDSVTELAPMHAEGAVAFKAFMKSAAGYQRIEDDTLYAGLSESRRLGTVVGVHAENEYVLNYLTQRLQEAGRKDRGAWLEAHTKEVELEAIQRALFWTRATGGTLLVLHISMAEGVRAVANARIEGVHAFAETCAHYLFFDSSDHLELGPYAKCSPPIRPRDDVEALWQCVLSGLIDTIGSDHSPYPTARYEAGMQTVWEAGGINGIQSIFPAMVTEGVHRRGMDWSLLARLMCANPARIFGLYPRKGSLNPGSDADFVVIDPNREWRLDERDLFSRYKHSPYVGQTFRGQILQTVIRGSTVYREGEIIAKPGYGKLIRRQVG